MEIRNIDFKQYPLYSAYKKIGYHLKKNEMWICSENYLIFYPKCWLYIKNWIKETPTKLEDVKKWGTKSKYLSRLLYILSLPSNEIHYETLKVDTLHPLQ